MRCILCERRCELRSDQKGHCKTRINLGGKLYTLVYGDISALESRPIEIKPFFHYWPGTTATTFSTWSCNLSCPWCQNHALSRTEPDPKKARYMEDMEVVGFAEECGDEGLCISFQEPTLLTEFAVDAFTVASSKGLYCCFVSNGYMTTEALKLLRDSGMTGLKIDVKGDEETYRKFCGDVDVEKVWRNARLAKSMGIHVEIVNLVVTNINDSEECIRGVIESHLRKLGPETPLHFTRYYPTHRFKSPATKVSTLEKAREWAAKMGCLYPYLGNVHGHPYENTVCPSCGCLLIQRYGYEIVRYKVTEEKCPRCRLEVPITGRYKKKY